MTADEMTDTPASPDEFCGDFSNLHAQNLSKEMFDRARDMFSKRTYCGKTLPVGFYIDFDFIAEQALLWEEHNGR